jgi:hypothetical protein
VLEVRGDPDGRAPPISVRGGGERKLACAGGPWAGCWTRPCGGGKKERELGGLGRKEEKERGTKKKGVGRA